MELGESVYYVEPLLYKSKIDNCDHCGRFKEVSKCRYKVTGPFMIITKNVQESMKTGNDFIIYVIANERGNSGVEGEDLFYLKVDAQKEVDRRNNA